MSQLTEAEKGARINDNTQSFNNTYERLIKDRKKTDSKGKNPSQNSIQKDFQDQEEMQYVEEAAQLLKLKTQDNT